MSRFRALQHRNFQLFFFGQLISLIGTWMQSTAQLWLVYKLTGSAALLGLFGFANQIAILLLASVGGYIGDRYNRHRGVIWTQTVSMILAFILAVLALTGVIKVWQLILIAFLSGIVNAFDVPIRQAFLVQMVGKPDLPNAIALNSSIFNAARVVGPAIGGLTIAFFEARHVHSSEGWCFLLNGFSFVAVLVALFAMRLPKHEQKVPEGSPFRNFVEGYKFAMSDFPIRSALLVSSLMSLLGLQYAVFMPIFAKDILHSGAKGFGYLMSAAGVGATLGALQFAARTNYKGLAKWIALMATICSVGVMVFSQSKMFWLSAIVLFAVGFAATSQLAATNTTVQNRVPDALRSRVMAVYATMFMGVQPLGALLAGGLAKHFGAPLTLAVFGICCLIGSVVYFAYAVLKLPNTESVDAQAPLAQ